jgi:glycosyltransferase involved in cell wall biosynthesis
MRHCLLYIVGQLGVGGYERQLYYLLRTIDRARYRPVVAVWNFHEDAPYTAQLRSLGVPLIAMPNNASAAAKMRALHETVKKVEPEVVHSYSFYTNFAAHWAARGTGAVSIGSLRSDFKLDKKAAGLWRGALCARWPRFQISNNLLAVSAARAARGFFTPARLAFVRNGLDLEKFPQKPPQTNGLAKLLGIGSLLPVKRWDRLITAAAELKRHGLRFHLQIAGEGPLREELRRLADESGLADQVELLGYVPDVSSLLSEAALLAHTSDTEGCPNSVMEAMACGRAVVATDVGDIPRIVEDGKTGFVVGSRDRGGLVSSLERLIRDPAECRRMGDLGRARAEQEFSLERLAAETLAAYREAGWQEGRKLEHKRWRNNAFRDRFSTTHLARKIATTGGRRAMGRK